MLLLCVERRLLRGLDCVDKTAKQVYDWLEDHYSTMKPSEINALCEKFLSITLAKSKSPAVFLDEFEEVVRQLRDADEAPKENLMILRFIEVVDPNYPVWAQCAREVMDIAIPNMTLQSTIACFRRKYLDREEDDPDALGRVANAKNKNKGKKAKKTDKARRDQ